MATNTEMEARLTSLETKVDQLPTGAEVSALADEMRQLSERLYGVEDRNEAALVKFDITTDALRADMKLVLEQIDNLRQQMQDGFSSAGKEHVADRQILYAWLRDHTRRLRAIERLQNRRRATPS